jgi:hypothetical protein
LTRSRSSGWSRAIEVEDDRQRLDDRALALLGEPQFLLDPEPLGIGAEIGVEQGLLLPRLALDLAAHREQVDEHRHLRAQHDRLDRLEHIVDRAHRIAADEMLGLLVDRRQEDDRDALGLLAVADDLGGLVAVHAGHVDVEQDDRELVLEEVAQRLLAGPRLDHLADILEHGADGEKVALVIVDDEDARPLGRFLPHRGEGSSRLRRAARLLAHAHPYSAASAVCWGRAGFFRRAAAGVRARSLPTSRARAIHTLSKASSRSMSTGLAI